MNIWVDRWVLKILGFKGSPNLSFEHSLCYVDELMIKRLGIWDDVLVSDLFPLAETNAILNILVSVYNSPHILVWHWFKNGFFMVQSG